MRRIVVVAVGTRLGDFTTASNSAFANPDVRFIAINVCELDAAKHDAIPLAGDALATLDELRAALPRIASRRRTRDD